FCLRKARIEVSCMAVSATGMMARNEKGRLRVTAINVTLSPGVAQGDIARLNRCLEIFEDFCPVTVAVRKGVDVRVTVVPRHGGIRPWPQQRPLAELPYVGCSRQIVVRLGEPRPRP